MFSVPKRILVLAWPSFAAVFMLILVVGAAMGAIVVTDRTECDDVSEGDDVSPSNCKYDYFGGVYFTWCVVFRSTYGEIIPVNALSRILTAMLALIGLLYIPYVLALVAFRRPTPQQHSDLMERLSMSPMDHTLLGDGYMVPNIYAELTQIAPENTTESVPSSSSPNL